MTVRVPKRRFYGQAMQFLLGSMHQAVTFRNDVLDKRGWEGRRVLGYKLPEWQRPEVWTDEQCVRFMESMFLGANVGAFMVNSCFDPIDLDQVLLDGQQRLRALERYWDNEFPVPDDDGQAWYWGDLTPQEQNHLYRITFPVVETQYRDEALLREAYNRHNFSGTPFHGWTCQAGNHRKAGKRTRSLKPSLCSTGRRPSLRPDLHPEERRAQERSRMAEGHRGSGAQRP